MITNKKRGTPAILLLVGLMSACSSTPWHENLMTRTFGRRHRPVQECTGRDQRAHLAYCIR